MSLLSTTSPTMLDLARRLDPDDTIADIVEIMNLINPMVGDMPFVEANGLTGHRTTTRTGIPTPTWRKMYQFVQPTKSTTAQVTDSIGMAENYAQVDKALADLNGNSAAWRLSEERPMIEGFAQEMASTALYGNEGTQPEAFTGIFPRFNSTTAASGDNIILGGGVSTPNTSILLAVWSPNSGHGIFPRGSKMGLTTEDHGQVTLRTAAGNMEAYETHYRQDMGLCIRDWRQFVRIPNIDVSLLTKDASSGADLIDLMTQALERVFDLEGGTPVFYANRRIRGFLRRQMVAKVVHSTLTIDMEAGKPVMSLDGVQIKRCDAILNTEALVS